MVDLPKLLFQRLGVGMPSYSSTRISDTSTQFTVKWPICFGRKHFAILSSFCVPAAIAEGEAGIGNKSAALSSVTMDVRAGSSQVTVFLVSDDGVEGSVDRFWADAAANR